MHTKKVSTYELFSSKPKYYYFLMVEFEQMVGKAVNTCSAQVNSSNKHDFHLSFLDFPIIGEKKWVDVSKLWLMKIIYFHWRCHEEPLTSMEALKVLYSGKGFWMFFTVRKNGSFKNFWLEGSFGNTEWFFYGITLKPRFWRFFF